MFPFQGPRDLLSKARRELDQLLKAVEPEEGDPDASKIADLTMNVAWALWHVTDWIANNDAPAIERIVASKGIAIPILRGSENFNASCGLSHQTCGTAGNSRLGSSISSLMKGRALTLK